MKVAYVTPFYNGNCEGRFGRFHDWIHTARDMDDPPFEFEVIALMVDNPDSTLSSQSNSCLGSANELWASKLNKAEIALNLPRIHRELRTGDYDVVHVLRLDGLIFPTVLSAIDAQTAVVIGPNIGGWSPIREGGQWDHDGNISGIKQQVGYRYRQLLTKIATYDIALSFTKYHRKILLEYGVDNSKIRVLKPGVSEIFSNSWDFGNESKKNSPTVLYVGDLSEHKGYDLFLRAIAKSESDFHAFIAGTGTPRRKLIHSLGIEKCITHLGFIERKDLPRYYWEADLFVMPSIDEMGPNTIIEALASGTPVVATDTEGINEFSPKDVSDYFSPRTPDALARAIDRSLSENNQRKAKKYRGKFLAVDTLSQLKTIYERIIE
ncbi:glycosyltransferase family 4 protein [Halovivax cerinus]|uniref:Glycosyltransferase family 4 protein n=1 Tax=Halovivax cerinus TaxID=1487865 RepID=A0ABD5NJ16_9EURY|nr:glycosyltransferase family 4 protein [Halovivax cerinus]